MAFIEGPSWLNTQINADREVFEKGITEPAAIEEVAQYCIAGALSCLRNMSPEELAQEPHIVYTIYGNGGESRYKVWSDGVVRMSRFHSRLQPDRIQKAEELGFEIFE